jgi:hypothetical protein
LSIYYLRIDLGGARFARRYATGAVRGCLAVAIAHAFAAFCRFGTRFARPSHRYRRELTSNLMSVNFMGITVKLSK